MKKLFVLISVIASLSLIIAIFVLFMNLSGSSVGEVHSGVGGTAMISWKQLEQQTYAKNSTGEFNVRASIASSRAILILYSFRAYQPKPLQFVAITQKPTNTTQTNTSLLKIDQAQVLGRMGDFELGVIKITPLNIPGQVISLKVTSPEKSADVWEVTPIEQLDDFSNDPNSYLDAVKPTSSGINIEFGGGGDENNRSIFKASLAGDGKKEISQNYFSMDPSYVFRKIDFNEYSKLTAPIPSTPNNDSLPANGYSPTIAPTRADEDN